MEAALPKFSMALKSVVSSIKQTSKGWEVMRRGPGDEPRELRTGHAVPAEAIPPGKFPAYLLPLMSHLE